MSRLTDLNALLEEYETAEITAGALEDIGALRMQNIRRGFDKNRAFFEEIKILYGVVQRRGKRDAPHAQRFQSASQLFVALTSNKRFYGTLTRDIIDKLIEQSALAPEANIIIVGKVGWQYFQQREGGRRARQLLFADDVPTPEEFESLLRLLAGFDHAFVLYPKFINPFRQEAAIEDITHSPEFAMPETKGDGSPESSDETPRGFPMNLLWTADAGAPIASADYLFEPEISAILDFFDTQVRRVLLDRVMLEAELSRTAARLFKMEDAVDHARVFSHATELRLRRERASVSNTQLLETYAGITQWRHT